MNPLKALKVKRYDRKRKTEAKEAAPQHLAPGNEVRRLEKLLRAERDARKEAEGKI